MSVRWSVPFLLVLFLLAACSRTGIVYNNADWLVYRWVDGLLDAEASQRKQWKILFEQTLSEHRRELLPELVVLLDHASQHAQGGLTHVGLQCLLQSSRHLLEAHARLALPAAVAVLNDVTEQQRVHLREQLSERNAEYRADFLAADPAQRESERVERYAERIERWTGDLSTAQMRLVENAITNMPDIAGDWLAYRERQQQRLVELLQTNDDPAVLREFLHGWWVEQRDREPRLIAGVAHITDASIELLVSLDATLDAAQRNHLQDQIDKLRDGLLDAGGEPVRLALQSAAAEGCSRVL